MTAIASQPRHLVPTDAGAVPIAQEVEHLDLIARARSGLGLLDLAEQVENGAVFFIGRRDRVVVVDDALTVSLVIVLDGVHHGRAGWVPAAWIHDVPALAA